MSLTSENKVKSQSSESLILTQSSRCHICRNQHIADPLLELLVYAVSFLRECECFFLTDWDLSPWMPLTPCQWSCRIIFVKSSTPRLVSQKMSTLLLLIGRKYLIRLQAIKTTQSLPLVLVFVVHELEGLLDADVGLDALGVADLDVHRQHVAIRPR